MPQQLGLGKAHHLAKGRIDIGDAALQVARTQAGQQRILHRFAKSQRIGQRVLGLEAPAHVLGQQSQHQNQGQRHGGDQRGQHIGEQIGRAAPAVHAQHQRGTGQIHQLLGAEHPVTAAGGAAQGQAGAIALGEGDFIIAHGHVTGQPVQHFLQGVGGHQVSQRLARTLQGQAQLHDLHPQTIGKRHKVAAAIGRAAEAAGRGTGQQHFSLGIEAPQVVKHRRAKRGVHLRAQLQRTVAPFNTHEFAVLAQQAGGIDRPGVGRRVAVLQGLQALHIARERGTHVAHGFGGITLQTTLHFGRFIHPGQPDQHGQHGHHQQHQRTPENLAPRNPGRARL